MLRIERRKAEQSEHDSKKNWGPRGPRGPRLHEVGADEQRDIACVTFARQLPNPQAIHQNSSPESKIMETDA